MDLRGPEFLKFYAFAFVFALVVVFLLRALAKESPDINFRHESGPAELDAYEIAYLAGGPRRVAESALASLYQRGLIEPARGRLRRVKGASVPPEVSLHPVERVLWLATETDGGSTISSLRRQNVDLIEGCGEKLRDVGWLISESRSGATRWISMTVLLVVPLLGGIKTAVGISRGRPVGFLVVACLISAVIAFAIGWRRPLRTRRGDAALENLRRKHGRTKATRDAAADLVAIAVALEGVGALTGMDWTTFRSTLQPTGSGAGSGGGCGTSSCGGGGGCGGGGCGGGGCGGCGG